MNRQSVFAMGVVLALAGTARAQNAPEPPLVPLVPPKAPWLKKGETKTPPKQAKKTRKKKLQPGAPPAAPEAPVVAAPPAETPAPSPGATPQTAPAVAAPQPALPELPLPPLVPPSPAPLTVSTLGILLENDGLDATAAAKVEEGLRGVVEIAPLTRGGPAVTAPAQPCADEACFAALGAAQKLDQVLVATYARGAVRVRLIDVAQKRQLAAAEQAQVAADALDATAAAEALACRILVPAGCTGELAIEAADGMQVEVDGKPLARGERPRLPVGFHSVKLRSDQQVTERAVAVTREGAPVLYAQQMDGEPRLLTFRPAPAPAAAVAAGPAPGPAPRRSWTRPAGIAAMALAGGAAIVGGIFGARSRSDLDKAESAYRANGGAYRAGDLDALSSGNSAARNANALFIASGVLLATGAILTFAF